jgi:hypothetical protein
MVKHHPLLHGVPTIHNDQGDIDVNELLALFQINQSQLARILGISRQRLHQSPYSDTVQRGLRRLEYLFARLRNLTGSVKNVRIWLKMAHPDFEGVAPIELLEQGHIEAIEDLVLAIETGQPR